MRTITLALRRKGSTETHGRLFTMTREQTALFERAVRTLTAQGLPELAAVQAVEHMVTGMLAGKRPQETDPTVFHIARTVFPTLSKREIEALPRFGQPRGFVRAIVLTIAVGQPRNVRVDFTTTQAGFFNFMIRQLVRAGASRDKSWLLALKIVGLRLGGAELPPDAVAPDILRRAVEVFQPLSPEQADALPTATPEDVRRLCYTEDHG